MKNPLKTLHDKVVDVLQSREHTIYTSQYVICLLAEVFEENKRLRGQMGIYRRERKGERVSAAEYEEVDVTCPQCDGACTFDDEFWGERPCSKCGGSGLVPQERKVEKIASAGKAKKK